MDVDPNYDPSDFLKMPTRSRDETSQSSIPETPKFDYNAINIKQEPQSQAYVDSQYDQSFDMSEMLNYQQPPPPLQQEVEVEPEQAPLPPPPEQHTQPLDDVGIHDDLAISDSDEDDQDFVEPKPDNDNDEEGDGLWF